jgi:hypothetical protein
MSDEVQRWISPDPVTDHVYDPESLNKYSYVRNDPVNLVDPDGRDPISISVTVWAPQWFDQSFFLEAALRGIVQNNSVVSARFDRDPSDKIPAFEKHIGRALSTLSEKLSSAKISDKCKKFFEEIRIDPAKFLEMLGKVTILSGIKNPTCIEGLVGVQTSIDWKMQGWTVGDLFQKGDPRYIGSRVDGFSPYGTLDIFLRPGSVTADVLGHEVFHQFADRSDFQLMLMIPGIDLGGTTDQISKKFKDACL